MPDSNKKNPEAANAPPRGRRRRKDARPAELIEAGLLEFAEKGFAAARMEDVAARAGVAKGTIYLYFDNKEALFIAAVRSEILPTVENVQELVGNFPGNAESLLRLVIRTMYKRLVSTDARVLLRILISEGPRFPALLEFYNTNLIRVAKGLIREILQRGVERGEFRANLPTDQPIIVAAPAIWLMTFDRFDSLDIEAYADAHIDIILNGLLSHC